MQYEFNISRLAVFGRLTICTSIVVGAVAIAFWVDEIFLIVLSACVAAGIALFIPRQVSLLFKTGPVLTINRSSVFHNGVMANPLPWSQITGVGVSLGNLSNYIYLEVKDPVPYERSGPRWIRRLRRRDRNYRASFGIWTTALKGPVVDVLRALADTDRFAGKLGLACYLTGEGKPHAEPGELKKLIRQLETATRTVEESVDLAWALLDDRLPRNASHAGRILDEAIKLDADYVHDHVRQVAEIDIVFHDIGRRRLKLAGHDVSDISVPDASYLADLKRKEREERSQAPRWRRLWAGTKAIFCFLFALLIVFAIPSAYSDGELGPGGVIFGVFIFCATVWQMIPNAKYAFGTTTDEPN